MLNKTSPKGKLILVGEDDIDDQDILNELFSSIDTSIELQFLTNGEELVYFLEVADATDLPCLILLDYNMPRLSGAEILANLKKNERLKNIPKVIWSTSNSATYKSKCLELGAASYLVKPSKVKDLEDMLKHILSFC